MRKLKDALRLKFDGGLSHQQIADALGFCKGEYRCEVDDHRRLVFQQRGYLVLHGVENADELSLDGRVPAFKALFCKGNTRSADTCVPHGAVQRSQFALVQSPDRFRTRRKKR